MDWTIIATIIASLGGREFFAWLANRKAYARKENAAAKDAELSVHEKQMERYNAQIDKYDQRLNRLDEKIVSLYAELRKTEERNLDLQEQINRLELDKEILILQKCEVRGCANRKPPSIY